MVSRRFGDFTYREIRACAGQGWLVVIPTGCTEQQGPHLPVDFDSWFAESLMVAVAVDWNDPLLDFAHYSSTGVIGDPTHASVELGKKLWEAAVEEAVRTFKIVAEVNL